jgi:hypothetical protein
MLQPFVLHAITVPSHNLYEFLETRQLARRQLVPSCYEQLKFYVQKVVLSLLDFALCLFLVQNLVMYGDSVTCFVNIAEIATPLHGSAQDSLRVRLA